ncbi:MAG TPA: hypothetical protein DHW81_06380 [Nitrospiraceae bacterium]|nr:hypothetical protein [Nitrospiraceae bacterium]
MQGRRLSSYGRRIPHHKEPRLQPFYFAVKKTRRKHQEKRSEVLIKMATKYIEINDDRPKPIIDKRPEDDYKNLDTKAIKEFSFNKSKYFQIDRNSLIPGSSVNFNIFIQKGMDFQAVIKADKESHVALNEELLNNFHSDAACEVVISEGDIHLYRSYLDSLLRSSKSSEKGQAHKKAFVIKENSKMLMKDLLNDPRSGEKIKEVKNSVNTITDSLLENKDMIYTMLTLSKYDYYTYTHCVNVAVLSIGLAIAIGLNKEYIENLGTGAMLHDIGKTAISSEILNKQGKLTEYEYKMIQEHVREGEKILKENKEIPEEAHSAVLQHHEKLSGKGYPYGLKGEEINLFGRVTGISDCYDALTTQRPYKHAFNPYEALKIISKETEDYDANLLTGFIKMLGKMKN